MTSRPLESMGMRNVSPRSGWSERRPALTALYTGLTITLVTTVASIVDRVASHTLADHIWGGYPDYSRSGIEAALSTYRVALPVVGVLGAAGWILTLHAVTSRRWWSPALATIAFVLGLELALAELLIKDTSRGHGVSPLIGWLGLIPCLPGLLAVLLLWWNPPQDAEMFEANDRQDAALRAKDRAAGGADGDISRRVRRGACPASQSPAAAGPPVP